MKSAVIFFHSNIRSLYKDRWIEKCIASVRDQTMQDFDVFEIDYSGEDGVLCRMKGHKHHFFSRAFDNHIQSMNFILNEVFKRGYDVVFNTNMDDFYSPDRFEKQLERINEGFDIVSSNFYYITEIGNNDVITHRMDMFRCGDIRKNLNRDHNVISHPCVAMHRRVWDGGMRYNNLIGYEDLDFWQRATDYKFSILQDYLLYYRIHENQITKTEYIK